MKRKIMIIVRFFIKQKPEKYIPKPSFKTTDAYKGMSSKKRLELYFVESLNSKKEQDLREIEKLTKQGVSNCYPLINI
jgi:hypothetical protein